MKFIAFDHEYDISNLPIDSGVVVNDLVLTDLSKRKLIDKVYDHWKLYYFSSRLFLMKN